MENQEKWYDLGFCKINRIGEIKTNDTLVKRNYGYYMKKGIIRKQYINNCGYSCVNLVINKKQKCFLVHRLVAMAFIPNPNNLPEVNHINEDKTDNRVENLEWCNHRYNINFGTHNKKCAEKLSKKIKQLTLNGDLVNIWDSSRQIERELNYKHICISRCCKGIYKTAYGYKWCYVN